MSPAPGMGIDHMFGTPPLGRSVDMVDMCTQLMEAGGKQRGEGLQVVDWVHDHARSLLRHV